MNDLGLMQHERAKPIDMGPLTPENVDQQFCSDWLKAEIRKLFKIIQERTDQRDALMQGEAEATKVFKEHLFPALDQVKKDVALLREVCAAMQSQRDAADQRARDLKTALRRIIGMAGLPDAAEACRKIIRYAEEAIGPEVDPVLRRPVEGTP